MMYVMQSCIGLVRRHIVSIVVLETSSFERGHGRYAVYTWTST